MNEHNQRWELRKARLVLRNRLRAYFAVLRLYALAQAEEDRRRFSAWDERAGQQQGPELRLDERKHWNALLLMGRGVNLGT